MITHRTLLATVFGLFLVVCVAAACGSGSSKPGAIEGRLVRAKDGDPAAGVQVILCALTSEAGARSLCTLLGSPTAVSDASGGFVLSEVPAGPYALVYGWPGELKLDSSHWQGLELTRAETCMENGINAICRSSSDGSLFWSSGGTYLGDLPILRFLAEGLDAEAKDAPVSLRYTQGTGGAYLYDGGVLSRYCGISIMVAEGKLAPAVQVLAGETSSIEWRVTGR